MLHILMATYNGERYIREQIDSIIEQIYTDWKLWINDDGSSDSTLNIIKEYTQLYPNKIKLLSSDRKGLGAKGNFAYLYSNVPLADFYAFCDQDDVWDRNKISSIMEQLLQESSNFPTLYYHNIRVVDSNKRVIDPSYFNYTGETEINDKSLQQILMYNYVPGCTMVFNHALKEKVIDIPDVCYMHDWWLLLSAFCLDLKVRRLDSVLGVYRQHGNNEMGAAKKISVVKIVLRCCDIINYKKYKKNNEKMFRDRLCHAQLLLNYYDNYISNEKRFIIENFINILRNKSRISRLISAIKSDFVFLDTIYTIKFYLMKNTDLEPKT